MCKSNALGSIWDARFGQNAALCRTCIPPFVVVVFAVVVVAVAVVVAVVVGGVHIRITIAAALPSRGDESSGGVGAIVPRAAFLLGVAVPARGTRPSPSVVVVVDRREVDESPPRGCPARSLRRRLASPPPAAIIVIPDDDYDAAATDDDVDDGGTGR